MAIDPVFQTIDDPLASTQEVDNTSNAAGMDELPYFAPVPMDQSQINNGLMSARQDGLNTVVGRLQSQDGKSFLDLDKGILQFNDGANDRLRMGSDA